MQRVACASRARHDPACTDGTAPPTLPRLLCIEGNIGVGKSTVMAALKRKYANTEGVVFLDEPVDEWRERGFLERMYNEPACKPQFQHMVLMSLAGNLLKALAMEPRPKFIIMERSPWSNYHVFGKTNLAGADLDMYKYTWENVLKGMPAQLSVRYILLSAINDPSALLPRLRARARNEESVVGVDYLSRLEVAHWSGWLEHEPETVVLNALVTPDAVLSGVMRQVWMWMSGAGLA